MTSSEIRFTFDGKRLLAKEGDTIASALFRNGIRIITRSVKFHRPRGLHCGTGDCPNCLVNVNGVPNVRACITPVIDGMAVRSQNIILSRNLDPVTLLDHIYRGGFNYHHKFIRPGFAKGIYQRIIRNMAGIGEVPSLRLNVKPAKRWHADVLIIGGEPAAAVATVICASAGARVIEMRPDHSVGGDEEEKEGPGHPTSPSYVRIVDSQMVGAFDDGSITAISGDRLHIVEPKFTIIAEGGRELPTVFPNWDLPGIMQEAACMDLLRRSVPIGRRIIVAGPYLRAVSLAKSLHESGNGLAAVLTDRLPSGEIDDWMRDISRSGWRIAEAGGRNAVSYAVIENAAKRQKMKCDSIVTIGAISPKIEIARQLGCKTRYRGKSHPAVFVGDGFETTRSGTFAIGVAAGIRDPDEALRSAEIAAKNIVARIKGAR